MNKGFSISLVLVLLVSVTGVSINTHYCHGMARYTVLATDADHASCCGDEMDACPSCEDRMQSNVMDDQSVAVAPVDLRMDVILVTLPPAIAETLTSEFQSMPLQPISHGPPGRSVGSAIPILVQSFLN